MTKPSRAWFLLLVVTAIASGCRNNDFMYLELPRQPLRVARDHKLKEVVQRTKIDIVWVIDNSGSMASHQRTVSQNSDDFIRNFVNYRGLPWSMALLSTDTANPPYLGFTGTRLDYTTADPVSTFQNAVGRLGTSGSASEMFFDPVKTAIERDRNFLRKDAVLALIIVSDAPEQSFDINSGQKFLDYLKGVKGSLDHVVIYGALNPVDKGCRATDSAFDYEGSRYQTVIEATRGKFYKLCDGSFGPALASIGDDMIKRVVRPRIYLEQRPKAATIRVTYDGQTISRGTPETQGHWLYDFELNAIVFTDMSFAPDEDEEVEIAYEIDDGFDPSP